MNFDVYSSCMLPWRSLDVLPPELSTLYRAMNEDILFSNLYFASQVMPPHWTLLALCKYHC